MWPSNKITVAAVAPSSETPDIYGCGRRLTAVDMGVGYQKGEGAGFAGGGVGAVTRNGGRPGVSDWLNRLRAVTSSGPLCDPGVKSKLNERFSGVCSHEEVFYYRRQDTRPLNTLSLSIIVCLLQLMEIFNQQESTSQILI